MKGSTMPKRWLVLSALVSVVCFAFFTRTALADLLVGGVVDSNSASITEGCFTRSGLTFSWIVDGTANYTDGGVATDWKSKRATCTSTGANISAAWSNALTTCPAAWKAANGL